MRRLTAIASPLFPFSQSIWPQSNSSKLAFLSFPAISVPITSAAMKMRGINYLWQLNPSSGLTDRIYAMCIACGLPLSAYNSCSEYEKMFFATKEPGRHYYEGKKSGTMKFSDWNRLPLVTPRSLLDVDTAPQRLKDMIQEIDVLYDKARKFGILDDDSRFFEPTSSGLDKLQTRCNVCEYVMQQTQELKEIPALQQAIDAVKQAQPILMSATENRLPTNENTGDKDTILRIQKDYFFASPALHAVVSQRVDLIEKAVMRAIIVLDAAEKKIERIRGLK